MAEFHLRGGLLPFTFRIHTYAVLILIRDHPCDDLGQQPTQGAWRRIRDRARRDHLGGSTGPGGSARLARGDSPRRLLLRRFQPVEPDGSRQRVGHLGGWQRDLWRPGGWGRRCVHRMPHRGPALLDLRGCMAPAMLLAQATGRLGNYFNHELFGQPTDLPWGLEIEATNPASRSGCRRTPSSTPRSCTR